MMAFLRRTDIAHWSTPWQLRKAGLFGDEGLILGRVGGQVLRHNGEEHMFVVAGTGSGKSTCLVIPNLLTWRQTVIAYDPAEELAAACAGWRSCFSRVVQLAPTSSTSHAYNLLDALQLGGDQEVRGVQLVSQMLIDPEDRGTDHLSDAGKHFQGMAMIALNGFILYGLYTQRARSLGALRAFYMSQALVHHAKTMQRYPHPLIREAGGILAHTDGHNERSGIFSTVAQSLWVYSDPLIQRATDSSQFTLRDIRERARPLTLFVSVPFGDMERLRPWIRTVLRQCFDHAMSRVGPWSWDILGIFDEAPSLRRFTLIHEGLGRVRKYGIRLMIVTPSMEAIIDTYGRHHSFLDGCKVKVVFGLEDNETPETFSQRVGETEVTRWRRTGRYWSQDRIKEPLISPTALKQLHPRKLLVIIGPHNILAKKTYYKHNREWLRRSQYRA
jgi:type IV secretion system protein VirD4